MRGQVSDARLGSPFRFRWWWLWVVVVGCASAVVVGLLLTPGTGLRPPALSVFPRASDTSLIATGPQGGDDGAGVGMRDIELVGRRGEPAAHLMEAEISVLRQHGWSDLVSQRLIHDTSHWLATAPTTRGAVVQLNSPGDRFEASLMVFRPTNAYWEVPPRADSAAPVHPPQPHGRRAHMFITVGHGPHP